MPDRRAGPGVRGGGAWGGDPAAGPGGGGTEAQPAYGSGVTPGRARNAKSQPVSAWVICSLYRAP
ncbi:hypothetical protein GCM10017752_65990 [Streptomyces roseoviridis]